MANIINNHPEGDHPFSISLSNTDEVTISGVEHRRLEDNGNNEIFINHLVPALEKHHISPADLERRKRLLESLKILSNLKRQSPYPQNKVTRKGNFAEVFLAEYLCFTTDTQVPIYRLRYNPNVEQAMKGDDVLVFDLDSDPVRIIVGEAKFRSTPSKKAVIDTIDGLIRSNQSGIPISLMFVAERLFSEGKDDIAMKVENCAILFATSRLRIDYVGLLMSNLNAKNYVNNYTENSLHNLAMISLNMSTPEDIVEQAFEQLEGAL